MTTLLSTTSSLTRKELARVRRLTADTIRGLAMDAVQKANSGHPGMPMGMADAAVVLWTHFLKHNPADPCGLIAIDLSSRLDTAPCCFTVCCTLSGYALPLGQLQAFRQWGSQTPGHPEYGLTPGIETTTGPLGQGITNAVGMAIAERSLAARFNRHGFEIVNHCTYVIASDGDLMEGVSHESCSLAGHLGLGKFIVLYDDNGISIDGPTSLSFSEDVLGRFAAYGWHTQRIDGHDTTAVEAALVSARAETERPSLIACKTHIGFGSPEPAGYPQGARRAAGVDEVRLTKEKLGWPTRRAIFVPEEARELMQESAAIGAAQQKNGKSFVPLTGRLTQNWRRPSTASSAATCRKVGTRTCRLFLEPNLSLLVLPPERSWMPSRPIFLRSSAARLI